MQDDFFASLGYTRKLLTSVKYLRNCFRRGIIGDRRSETFNLFWTAVARSNPGVEIVVDKPTSSRNTLELQPAFDLCVKLLHDKPEALTAFVTNGTSPESTTVPELVEALHAFMASDSVSACVDVHVSVYVCACVFARVCVCACVCM